MHLNAQIEWWSFDKFIRSIIGTLILTATIWSGWYAGKGHEEKTKQAQAQAQVRLAEIELEKLKLQLKE